MSGWALAIRKDSRVVDTHYNGQKLRVSTKRRPKTEDRRPKTEDRRPKNEDPNFFMPDKAQTGKKPSQSVPQRKQMQK